MARPVRGTLPVALLAVLGALAACQAPRRCAYCAMDLSASTRTVVLDSGQRKVVCDPRCALTERAQSGRRITLEQVTDFGTGRPLAPAAAHFVTGSRVSPDVPGVEMRTWPAETARLHWHRCLPSTLAFASLEAADRFQREHGGRVVTLGELGFEP